MIAIATIPRDYGDGRNSDATELWVTNSFVGTAIAQTATAKAYTATPTPAHRATF